MENIKFLNQFYRTLSKGNSEVNFVAGTEVEALYTLSTPIY